MGGEETVSEVVPRARLQAGRRDDGLVVAMYLPQGKSWVLCGCFIQIKLSEYNVSYFAIKLREYNASYFAIRSPLTNINHTVPPDVWECFGKTDGPRKLGFLKCLEVTAKGDFSMTETVVVHHKHVATSGGEDEQLLLVRPGPGWAASAAKFSAGLSAPWGKNKITVCTSQGMSQSRYHNVVILPGHLKFSSRASEKEVDAVTSGIAALGTGEGGKKRGRDTPGSVDKPSEEAGGGDHGLLIGGR